MSITGGSKADGVAAQLVRSSNGKNPRERIYTYPWSYSGGAALLPALQPAGQDLISAKRSLPTADAALPEFRCNKERAVRRVRGVLDSKILPMRRVMPDREAVGQH